MSKIKAPAIPPVVIAIIVLIILGCAAIATSITFADLGRGGVVETIEAQGMTCIVYKKYKDSVDGGITCNWSEWNGDQSE